MTSRPPVFINRCCKLVSDHVLILCGNSLLALDLRLGGAESGRCGNGGWLDNRRAEVLRETANGNGHANANQPESGHEKDVQEAVWPCSR